MRRIAVYLVFLAIIFVGVATAHAQTVSAGDGHLAVGAATTIPITLSSASRGVSDFEITISLANGDVADLEMVLLPPEFNKYAEVIFSADHDSVSITTSDEDQAVEAGVGELELAQIKIRGTFKGRSAIIVAVNRLDDDQGSPINPAIRNGELEVISGPSLADPTVIGGSDGVLVDATVETPIILSNAPNGLSSYRLTVSLGEGSLADIEGVYFSAFEGDAEVDLSPTHDSVSFSASDVNHRVEPGAVGVILARVVIRGVLPGSTSLEVTINRIEDEQGAKAASAVIDGTIVVNRLLDPPPAFTDKLPLPGSTIELNQPTISVTITDIGGGVRPETIAVRVTDGTGRSKVFSRESAGALWDGERFSVSLAQAGFALADGWAVVEVAAEDDQGHLGITSWRFIVAAGGPPPPPPGGKTIEQAIASLVPGDPPGVPNPNSIIGDQEILKAVEHWITGEVVPGTGGQTIDDDKMLELIQLWITGTPISSG